MKNTCIPFRFGQFELIRNSTRHFTKFILPNKLLRALSLLEIGEQEVDRFEGRVSQFDVFFYGASEPTVDREGTWNFCLGLMNLNQKQISVLLHVLHIYPSEFIRTECTANAEYAYHLEEVEAITRRRILIKKICTVLTFASSQLKLSASSTKFFKFSSEKTLAFSICSQLI